MTSRQPGTTPPGHAGMTGDTGTRGDTGTPGNVRRPGSGPRWPVLVVPLTLLIILGLTGLRGAVTKPRWDGPLQRDGVIIGLALEVVLGVLLVHLLLFVLAPLLLRTDPLPLRHRNPAPRPPRRPPSGGAPRSRPTRRGGSPR